MSYCTDLPVHPHTLIPSSSLHTIPLHIPVSAPPGDPRLHRPQNKKLDADLKASISIAEVRRQEAEKKGEELVAMKLKLQVRSMALPYHVVTPRLLWLPAFCFQLEDHII